MHGELMGVWNISAFFGDCFGDEEAAWGIEPDAKKCGTFFNVGFAICNSARCCAYQVR
jgi:hypothetical protein